MSAFSALRVGNTHHVAARVAYEEDRSTSVLSRARQSLQHVLFWPSNLAIGIVIEQFLHHGRYDITGRDGVDPNLVYPPFHGEIAG